MDNKNTIDCFGDICPIPVLKATEKLKTLKKGESFMLVTDHSCVVESIKEKYPNSKIVEAMAGVWEITFFAE